MIIDSLSMNTNMYSLGSILGGSTNQEILNQINRRAGGCSFFGSAMDPLRTGFQTFMTKVVEPVREAKHVMSKMVNQIFMTDEFRPIDSIEELKRGIPPCMQKPILYFEPVRTLLNEDRIDGFGIDPKTLEVDDPYEDLCNNGKVTYVASELKSDVLELKYVFKHSDPKLTVQEVIALSKTRDFIADFLNDEATKHFDPTDYPRLHG